MRTCARTGLTLKNDVFCYQDDPQSKIHVIVDGIVRLSRSLEDGRRQVVGFLGPGDLLGGLKRGGTAHCTAQAVTDVIACSFSRDRFTEIAQDYPDLIFNLLITATDEIEAQHDHVVLLGCRTAKEKIATLILLWGHRWHVDPNSIKDVRLPMSRQDIADYLGLTVETVSRTLSALKAEGVIEMPRRDRVLVRKLAKLYSIAGVTEIPERGISMGF